MAKRYISTLDLSRLSHHAPPMHLAVLLLALPLPAAAWDFTPVPVCTIAHDTATARWTVTYDPSTGIYAIAITRTDGIWPDAPLFGIRFDGPGALTITTDRQTLTNGGTTLTVTDRGFGNVLAGLERNATATATTGTTSETVALGGVAAAVAAFRDCPGDLVS